MTLPGSLWTPQACPERSRRGERLLRPIAGGAEPSLRGGGQDFQTLGADAANSRGTLVDFGVNVKGAWVELSAATPMQADGLLVTFVHTNPLDALVDIGIGAAGSEQVIVPDLFVPGWWYLGATSSIGGAGSFYFLPVAVPEGERLAVRGAGNNGRDRWVTVQLIGGAGLASKPLNRAASYGAVAADSGATSIDPGATINTEGAWTEIAAAVSFDARELLITIGHQNNSLRTAATWLLDIGIGAAGAEVELISDLQLATPVQGVGVPTPRDIGPIPVNIPEDTRIAARAQCSLNDAADRTFDLAVMTFG